MKTLKSILILLALATVEAASAQTISVTPTSLSLSGQAGGASVSQSLTVLASGGNTSIALFPSQPWLTVTPALGTTPLQVTVTANPAGLAAGAYQDTNFRIVGANNTVIVPVTFTVSSIAVAPASLNFAYTAGGTTPQSQTLTLTGQAVSYSISANTSLGGNWLQPVQTSGSLPANGTITVLLNPMVISTLSAATYQGTVTVTPSGSPAITVPVTLTVSPQPPVTVTPSAVSLNYQIGGLNNLGAQQPVTIATTSTASLNYQFATPTVGNNPQNCNWITVNPASGSIPANSSAQSAIGFNCPGLGAGTYSGSVSVTVPGASPQVTAIPVNLNVSNSPLLILPTGALNFSYEIGTNPPAAQSVTPQSTAVLASATSGQMPVTTSVSTASGANWLSVSPSANLTTGTPISVSANPAGLLPGIYMGTVTVTPAAGANAGNGAQTIQVTLTVANDPAIQASTTSLSLPYQVGQAAPAAQTINLTSSIGAQLTYSVTSAESTCGSVNWLSLGGTTSGLTNGSFTVVPQNLASLSAGTCTGTITVNATNSATGNPAVGSPLSIPVTLVVSNNPLLVVNPLSLVFISPVSGAGTTQVINVTSTNPSSNISYAVTETTANGGNGWLTVTSSGSTVGQNAVNVSVNPGLLSAGIYSGTVTITANGGATDNSPVTIPVTLQVTTGTLALSTTSLPFTYTTGGSNPRAQTVQVTSNGSALNFTASANSGTSGVSWLSVTPTSGATPGTLSISVDGSKLNPGTYLGTVTVSAPNASNSPASIGVTLVVNGGSLSATPAPSAGLTFTQASGGAVPAAQSITLTGTPGPFSFITSATTSTGANWLSVSPASGSTPGTVQVSVSAGNLALGTYNGTVTITAPGATGSPLTYAVTLNVVTPITITATPATLTYAYILNAGAPAAQTVQIGAVGSPGVLVATFPFAASVKTNDGANWLSVTPMTGTDPGSISVSINPQGLAAGNYTGTLTVASGNQNGAAPATVTVRLSVSAAATPVIAAIANGASGFNGAISPGEQVTIYGLNFGPSGVVTATPSGGAYPVTLSNTQVLFDGVAAPIVGVTNGQVNVMVPYGIAGRATTGVQVSYLGVTSTAISYSVTSAVPGIYTLNQTGSGQGAILNADYTVTDLNHPAASGSVVQVFMTGEGVTSPPSITGQQAVSLNKPVLGVTATINGVPAAVKYYGSAPGLIYGVMQVNVEVPANIPSGANSLVITVGSANSQTGVTLAVK